MNRRYRTPLAADSPRPDCADCVRKHLGQAGALIQESFQGYPDHFWLAVGHLAEAEAESQGRWPDFAVTLRDERKRMEEERGYTPDIVALIHEVTSRVMDEAVREAATKVEKTKPGSKLEYRLTYSTGSKKWTNDRPGDGVDPDRDNRMEELFSRGDVKRALKSLEGAVEKYLQDGTDKSIKDAVDSMVVDAGEDATKDVIRHVDKIEKAQLKSGDGPAHQDKVVKALGIAKKRMSEKIARVARIARQLESPRTAAWMSSKVKDAVYELLLDDIGAGPFDGGCVVVAMALQKIYGGKIMVLVRPDGVADHAVLQKGSRMYDFDGPGSEKQVVKRFEDNEMAKISEVRPMKGGDLGDASKDKKLAQQIADVIQGKEVVSYVTADEMEQYCPDCALQIREGGLKVAREELDEIIRTADKWKKMPKGWTKKSRKKFWESLTKGNPEHRVTECIKKMTGKFDDPGAFCASLADRVLGTTKWRGKKKDK